MAPYIPEEVDVFTVPHSRMKDLVNDYVEMLQTTNFSNFADVKLLLDSLSETFKEFKLHEQIENNLIMKRLKNKLKALSIRNTLVCNCHKDTHLSDMLTLVQEGFGKKNDQDRLNYSLQLKKSLEEFTEDFLPHMKQEEEVFQPMLLEYFSYEELCELKRKVIDYHTLRAPEVIEKGLREDTEKNETTDSGSELEDEDDWCESEEEDKEEPPTVLDLPPEVMTQVFSYLDPQQLAPCRQVCHQWNQRALDPILWTEIHPTKWAEGNWRARMEDVDYDLEEEEQEEKEEDEGYVVIDDDADIDESESDSEGHPDMSDYSKRVHRQAQILVGLVKYVLPSVGHSVKVLNLGHCHALTNGMLQRLLKLAPNVEYLNLAGTRISDSGLKGLGKNWCGLSLRHLNLSGCGNLTDASLERVANALSGQLVKPLVNETPCWCEQQRLDADNDQESGRPASCVKVFQGDTIQGQAEGDLDKDICDKTEHYAPFVSASPPVDTNGEGFYSGSETNRTCNDGCHVQCPDHGSYLEPDPIEDCARSMYLSPGNTLAQIVPPPSGERTMGVERPPDKRLLESGNKEKTVVCPKGQLFEDDVFGEKDRKPQKLLTYLNLSGCHQLTDYGISALMAAGPLLNLTHLDLSGCVAMTGDGLQPLVGMCPALHHDTLFYCDNILDGPYAETASGCQNVYCGRRVCCRKET